MVIVDRPSSFPRFCVDGWQCSWIYFHGFGYRCVGAWREWSATSLEMKKAVRDDENNRHMLWWRLYLITVTSFRRTWACGAHTHCSVQHLERNLSCILVCSCNSQPARAYWQWLVYTVCRTRRVIGVDFDGTISRWIPRLKSEQTYSGTSLNENKCL